MPGICGFISTTAGPENEERLRLMVGSLMHEDFYVSGTYIDEASGLYAGWTAHPGSFADCMPVLNEKKDVALIFAGENFADKAVTDKLKGRNHNFNASNASYLVHMYEERGPDFLADLNGWFTGVLVDLRDHTVMLFNDPFGMQRLYYCQSGDAFYFSSEAKSLLKVIPESRALDPVALGEFFSCDCALEHRTLFRNIHLLPGGSFWVFSRGRMQKKGRYLDPESLENQTLLDDDFLFEKIDDALTRIVPRYFRSDQRIGISLTGGLDTRIVMAYLDATPEKYPCYTFGGMYRDSFDVKIAREVATACHQTHQVITVDGDFLSHFQEYAERTVYISDGGLDVGGAPELYINRLARQIAPIRVTGNYGSEVLRSVRFLKPSLPRPELFEPEFYNGPMRRAVETYGQMAQGNSLSFTMFRDLPWHEYGRLSVEQSQLTPRSPFMDLDLVRMMYRAVPSARMDKEMSRRLVSTRGKALSAIPTDRGLGANGRFLAEPLRHSAYEFLFKAEYAYNYGMPQWLAGVDHALAPLHLERLFLGRHKFLHFRVWYRDQLADYVRDVLLDSRSLSRPYLNRAFVEKMVASHVKGVRNYTTEITTLLTAELIHRLLIEAS